ncbi:MAG: hypothetical protein ABI442_14560 [Gemmatimonadaceae bacterium]
MTITAIVDHGTLAAAHSVLFAGSSPFVNSTTDISLACFASLTENLIFFDKLILPGIPHGFSNQLARAFGDAIEFMPLDGALWHAVEEDSLKWVCENVDFKTALDLSHMVMNGMHIVGSTEMGIAAALSVVADSNPITHHLIADDWSEGDSYSAEVWPKNFDVMHRLFAGLVDKHKNSDDEVIRSLSPRFAGLDLWNVYHGVFRTRCYELLSRSLHVPYLPHPLRARSALGIRCLEMRMPPENPFLTTLSDAYDSGRHYVQEKTGDWMEPFNAYPVLPFVLAKCKTKEEILERVYDIRDSRGARKVRAKLALLCEAQSLRQRVALSNELDLLKRTLAIELGTQILEQKISFNIVGLVSISLPVPDSLARFVSRSATRLISGHLLFLRNIFKEMIQVSALGERYEFLTKASESGGSIQLTESDVAARAQYLHAILMNFGETYDNARRLTFKVSKQRTGLPASGLLGIMTNAGLRTAKE